jgi:hypothetical protein
MSGLAESPYSNSPLPPEIAHVLHTEMTQRADESIRLRAELALSELSPYQRTLTIVVPAGELLLLRYVRRPGDAELPFGERIDVIGGTLQSLPRSKFIYSESEAGKRRKRTGLKILDQARAAQIEEYRKFHEGHIGRGKLGQSKPPKQVENFESKLSTIEQFATRRIPQHRAVLLGGLVVRRQIILDDILRVATLDYVQGVSDPETARERIPQLYYDFNAELKETAS